MYIKELKHLLTILEYFNKIGFKEDINIFIDQIKNKKRKFQNSQILNKFLRYIT